VPCVKGIWQLFSPVGSRNPTLAQPRNYTLMVLFVLSAVRTSGSLSLAFSLKDLASCSRSPDPPPFYSTARAPGSDYQPEFPSGIGLVVWLIQLAITQCCHFLSSRRLPYLFASPAKTYLHSKLCVSPPHVLQAPTESRRLLIRLEREGCR
jgi:hypothetical protein